MTLPPGARFGPYEVVAPLGAGGMGEVYRARDTRLGREVALKVLPEELSRDENRLRRFEQEARSASALNHPNIVTVYDIGESDSTAFIAMELVDGRTLREIAVEPLPIRRLLTIAVQVAEGLAKAHGVGIVHRDLKPENVMVSKDGFVKILDFGLAKLIEPQSGNVTAMPTVAETRTQPGTVMGTVAYMSPEQASGLPVDYRSDQFSFGTILYEVATGRRAFEKKTAAETMSAIIREEHEPLEKLRAQVPPPLRWIIDRCLAKDPDERYASTRDLARELANVRDHISEIASGAEFVSTTKGFARLRSRRVAALTSAVLILLVGAVGGWLVAASKAPKTSAPTFRRLTYRSGALHNARFTPDGQTIVYGASFVGAPESLYMVRPESPDSRPFEMRGDILAISAAGEMAVMLHQNPLFGTLALVPLAGGVPRPAVEGVPYASADWSADGKQLMVVRYVDGRTRLEFPLGKVLHEGPEINAPRFSRDGDSIAFFQRGKEGSVMVMRKSGEGVRAIATGFDLPGGAPCWSPDGKEVWFTGSPEPGRPSGLYAADLGGRVRLVAQMPGELELDDISRDGRVLLAYHTIIGSMRGLAPGESVERDLTWLDLPIPSDISADGKTVLFTESGEGGGRTSSVYLRSIDGSPPVRLGDGQALALAPDGKSVLVSFPNAADRFVILPTGTGEPRTIPLTGFEEIGAAAAWFPAGTDFFFSGREKGRGWRVYRMDSKSGRPRPLTPEGLRIPGSMTGPVSPDGRFFFGARGPGRWFRFPVEGGEPTPVAGVEAGDFAVRWASDRALWVRRPVSGELWRADILTGRKTEERVLNPPEATLGLRRVVMTPDGRGYVYGSARGHSVLYVVEGLR